MIGRKKDISGKQSKKNKKKPEEKARRKSPKKKPEEKARRKSPKKKINPIHHIVSYKTYYQKSFKVLKNIFQK
jgi:hypothetical protein